MNIAPFSPSASLFPNASNALAKSKAPSSAYDQDSTDPKDIIAEIANGGSAGLVKYQQKQIADKARQDVLNSLGLTEADLKTLSPEKLASVDDAVAKAVKDALKASIQGSDKTKNAAAQANEAKTAAATPTTKSLISSDTLNALFDAQ